MQRITSNESKCLHIVLWKSKRLGHEKIKELRNERGENREIRNINKIKFKITNLKLKPYSERGNIEKIKILKSFNKESSK